MEEDGRGWKRMEEMKRMEDMEEDGRGWNRMDEDGGD